MNRRTSDLRRSLFTCGVPLALLVLLSSATFAAKSDVLEAELRVSAAGYAPGAEVRLALVATIDPKWHINSNTPSSEFLIPAELSCEATPQLKVDDVVYPEGKDREFAFSEEPLSVYDGRLVIFAQGVLGDEASPGTLKTTCSFSYQACDDRKCKAPESVELPLEITILEPGQTGKAMHEKVFARFPEQMASAPAICGR